MLRVNHGGFYCTQPSNYIRSAVTRVCLRLYQTCMSFLLTSSRAAIAESYISCGDWNLSLSVLRTGCNRQSRYGEHSCCGKTMTCYSSASRGLWSFALAWYNWCYAFPKWTPAIEEYFQHRLSLSACECLSMLYPFYDASVSSLCLWIEACCLHSHSMDNNAFSHKINFHEMG